MLVWVLDRATAVAARTGDAGARRATGVRTRHARTGWRLLAICGAASPRGLKRSVCAAARKRSPALRDRRRSPGLADLHGCGDASHDTVLAVLKPASAFADPLVALLARQRER